MKKERLWARNEQYHRNVIEWEAGRNILETEARELGKRLKCERKGMRKGVPGSELL